jgi:hypothetical protein
VYFLALFDWASHSRWRREYHDFLHRTALTDAQDCVGNRISAIRHELHRGTTNSAQAAFEKAVTSDACKHNIDLWTAYIRFCAARKELRAKAKGIYYRAIQNCPWSKGLAMEAFTTLAREMESSDLRAIFNTLVENGLRIHVDMEEFIAQWKRRADRNPRKERAG